MFKKVTISPSQPGRAETRLSAGKAAHCLLRPEGRNLCFGGGLTSEYVSTTKGRHLPARSRSFASVEAGNVAGLSAEAYTNY
jgi:hypothetical protein